MKTIKLNEKELDSIKYIKKELNNAYHSVECIRYELENIRGVLEKCDESAYENTLDRLYKLKEDILGSVADAEGLFNYATYMRRDY